MEEVVTALDKVKVKALGKVEAWVAVKAEGKVQQPQLVPQPRYCSHLTLRFRVLRKLAMKGTSKTSAMSCED